MRRWEWSGDRWSDMVNLFPLRNPRALAFKDIDADGLIDIVASGIGDPYGSSELGWWRQTGTGELIGERIMAPRSFYSLAITDLDADGDNDILAASSTDEIIYSFRSMLADSESISGRVSSISNGLAIPNALVSIEEFGQSARTNAYGRYIMIAPAGTYTLRIDADCWDTEYVTGVIVEEEDQAHVDVGMRQGHLVLERTSINLMSVFGAAISTPISLVNDGQGSLNLTVSPVEITPAGFWMSVDLMQIFIAPGDSQQVNLRVFPDTSEYSEGQYFGEVQIHSPACPGYLVTISVAITILAASGHGDLPQEFQFSTAYPNPFNASVNLEFELASAGATQLNVYDVTGREVAKLVNESLAPGVHHARWDGKNAASGVYIARLVQGENMATQKLLMIK
ncbi:MAG: T9SS type A sorting domain-containing protein [bacterium]|nr:T9SS type A sorting domain-containing protein [bacterium]